jgi:putative ABC transport system permease protein
MVKHKIYATINIFGMSLAFLCGLLLFLNAFFELSFDDFFLDGDRIYKVYSQSQNDEETRKRLYNGLSRCTNF